VTSEVKARLEAAKAKGNAAEVATLEAEDLERRAARARARAEDAN
jgi:hypothetical protein